MNPHSAFEPADFKSLACDYKVLYLNELLPVTVKMCKKMRKF